MQTCSSHLEAIRVTSIKRIACCTFWRVASETASFHAGTNYKMAAPIPPDFTMNINVTTNILCLKLLKTTFDTVAIVSGRSQRFLLEREPLGLVRAIIR